MREERFYRAKTLEEACELLARYGEEAHVLAGGTDLMVKVNRRLVKPDTLIYIGESGLDYIRKDADSLIIGATTTFADIVSSSAVLECAPLLREASRSIGSPAVRNMATLGGNLANASPAADSATALLALGARFTLTSHRGTRSVRSEEFFLGPGRTALRPEELLEEVIVPFPESTMKWAYRRIGRRQAHTLSVVSAALSLQMNGNVCRNARLALGAVAPVPLLATEATALLKGKCLDADLIARAAEAAARATEPIDDARASAWYRRRACAAVVKGLLEQIGAPKGEVI